MVIDYKRNFKYGPFEKINIYAKSLIFNIESDKKIIFFSKNTSLGIQYDFNYNLIAYCKANQQTPVILRPNHTTPYPVCLLGNGLIPVIEVG